MHIVIPYVTSPHNELKYALRSIEKFQSGSKVLLVGDKPDWYVGEYLYHTRNDLTKQLNVLNKIIAAIPLVSDDFILWYDDLFQLHPIAIINSHYGTLKEAAAKKNLGQWFQANVENTMKIYPGGLYYGNHRPIVINGVKFKEAMNVDWNKDYLVKSLYGNYVNEPCCFEPDCKFRIGDIRELNSE